ncbi:MAG: DinB family protein, partial [Pseudomonadota bacterium]|nr:DinB family protein [Pseudomonadota bacterium]
MTVKAHFELLATYNQWMNNKVYEAALRLENTELTKDRGAFFGSILGTLNHIYVGDIIWLKRFSSHPTSPSL